jgi:hypothetical protein
MKVRYKYAGQFPESEWPVLEVVDVSEQYVIRTEAGHLAIVSKHLYEEVA